MVIDRHTNEKSRGFNLQVKGCDQKVALCIVILSLILPQVCFPMQLDELLPPEESVHPIFGAIQGANPTTMEEILATDPSAIHAVDHTGSTPLNCVTFELVTDDYGGLKEDYMRMACSLLEAGADVNKRDLVDQDTALDIAVRHHDLDFVKFLLSYDANVENVWATIFLLDRYGLGFYQRSIVRYLLQCGFSVDGDCAKILENNLKIPQWRSIRACAGHRVFDALQESEEGLGQNVPREINALMISFLSVAWGEQFGVKINQDGST